MDKKQTCIYSISGLSCASCASSAQKVLSKIDGVDAVKVNFATHSTWLATNSDSIGLKQLNLRLQPLGFELSFKQKKSQQNKPNSANASRLLVAQLITSLVAACLLFLSNIFLDISISLLVTQWLLSSIAIAFSGSRFFRSAFQQLRWRRVNMDSLVALGVGTAYMASSVSLIDMLYYAKSTPVFWYVDTAVMLLVFILFGKLLESRSLQKTNEAIDQLIALQPEHVQMLKDDAMVEVPIEMIEIGDIIKVKTGAIIPLDGINIEEPVSVDESLISGESIPLLKKQGATCLAGSVVQQGVLVMKVTQTGAQTSLQQIIELVENAQNSQLPVQQLVDRVVQLFVPAVLLIALITFMAWAYQGSMYAGLIHAIAVLLVACPCALGLATPVAVVVGIGRAAQKGILFSRAAALQQLADTDIVLFDKTGTLTKGFPVVKEVAWQQDGLDQFYLLSVLNAIEQNSLHPLANAFTSYAQALHLSDMHIKDFKNYPGMGVVASCNGKAYALGNHNLLSALSIDIKLSDKPTNTCSYFVEDQQLLAIVQFEDPIKESAFTSLQGLQKISKSIKILSGDHEKAVQSIAQQLRIKSYAANLLPQDKLKEVVALQQAGKKVLMIGDGINDAPALAQADVGLAMHKGADVAMAAADVVLRSQNLVQINDAFKLSAQTLRIIRQNLFWAFIYNILLLPIAAGCFSTFGLILHPMMAAAAMSMSSVLVLMNSLRLRSC